MYLNLLSADFLFLTEVYSIMSCVVPNIPVITMESDFFSWSTEATLARSGISAFTYDLPLAGIFLSVADTLLLVLLVCFCHPSEVHLPLGRAITASLTLMMLPLVVPLLANLVVLAKGSFLLTELLFIRLLKANRIQLACDLWYSPLLSNPMRVLFNPSLMPY